MARRSACTRSKVALLEQPTRVVDDINDRMNTIQPVHASSSRKRAFQTNHPHHKDTRMRHHNPRLITGRIVITERLEKSVEGQKCGGGSSALTLRFFNFFPSSFFSFPSSLLFFHFFQNWRHSFSTRLSKKRSRDRGLSTLFFLFLFKFYSRILRKNSIFNS